MTTTTENNKRIAKNTLLLYFRMLLTMAVSLYTSRIVLNALGVEDFGIYNVVGGVVAMFTFINGSTSGATQRFLSFALGKNDPKHLKKTFSTCLIIHVILSIIMFLVVESIGLWFLWNKLQIPPDRMDAAFGVFQCSVVSMLVMIMSIPYNATIIAHERMSAFAYISIFETFSKLAIAYLIMCSPFDKLTLYAILLLLVQIIVRFCYSIYCNRHFTESKFQWCFDKSLFKEMLVFSGWTMNGNLAVIGYTQGLNILLNIFFGPVVNAARGIAVQVQTAVYGFCTNFQMAVNPQITKSYAKGDYAYMHRLVITCSKYSFFLLLFLSLPVILQSTLVLTWWLKIVPEQTEIFLVLILCTNMLNALSRPVVTSIHATGNIKKFQIIEGSLLLTILPIAYLLLRYAHAPAYMVFVVHLIVETLTQYVRIRIVLPQIKMSIKEYYIKTIIPIMKVTCTGVIIPLVLYFAIKEQNLYSFLLISIVCVISIAASVYFFGCTENERIVLYNQIHKLRNKFQL